jgi:hypothetical protein
MRAIFINLIARLERWASEGKSDMTELTNAAEAVVSSVVANAETAAAEVVTAVENAGETIKSDVIAAAAPIATDNDDQIISTIKRLIAIDGGEPKAWDQLVALAKAKASGTGIDATIAKLKLVLPLSGAPVVAWDETIAAAKALTAA